MKTGRRPSSAMGPTVRRLAQRLVAWLGRLLVLALLLASGWLAGLVGYVAAMPERVEDPASRTDVIVVLTGGSERLATGLDLLRRDVGDVLFISGVFPETRLETLLREDPAADPLRQRIFLGHVAADTIGNAIETAVWMREHRWTSVRLVTAGYHMRRSLMEFEAALPGVRIVPHPVFPAAVKRDNWWQYPGTAALFATEYTKYLAARLRLSLPDTPITGTVMGTGTGTGAGTGTGSVGRDG